LKDKVALITGGGGDIGKATARLFLEKGAKVALVDLSKESLDQAVKELKEHGEVISIQADVSKEDEVKNYVSETVEKWGRIDAFFNNAGIEGEFKPLIDQDLDQFQKVIDVNLTGVFLGLKYVLPVMIKQNSGSVINTSSDAGWTGAEGLSPYVATKHAVGGLTKTAALEVAEHQIRVNSIQPTGVNTKMMEKLDKESTETGDVEGLRSDGVPLGRYAETSEVGNLVLFLASDESKFITGSQYRIDGGISATTN